MDMRDGAVQHGRSPNFPGAGTFQQIVARRIALDADCVQARAWILDGEVETESVALTCGSSLPSQGMNVFTDQPDKTIALLTLVTLLTAASVCRRSSNLLLLLNSPEESARAYSR